MTIYGKKPLRAYMERVASSRVESRDAILWDVIPSQNLCRVKIQGSNELITAHFPLQWEKNPTWLKPGNAVRIVHTGGNRGRVELAGPGQTVPTPVSGSTFPTAATPPDSPTSGCRVTQIFNNPQMAVQIHTGSYRIGGTTYYLAGISMANGDDFVMGDGGAMGDIAGIVAINAAPSAGSYRFDMISIGADGVIDYTAGTPTTGTPVKPTVGAAHVLLAYVRVGGGDTAILQPAINQDWSPLRASNIMMSIADKDFGAGDYQTNVTLTVCDQYNHPLNPVASYYLTLEIYFATDTGTFDIWSSEDGWKTDKVGQHVNSSAYTFQFRRSGPESEISILLRGVVMLEDELMVIDGLQCTAAA